MRYTVAKDGSLVSRPIPCECGEMSGQGHCPACHRTYRPNGDNTVEQWREWHDAAHEYRRRSNALLTISPEHERPALYTGLYL